MKGRVGIVLLESLASERGKRNGALDLEFLDTGHALLDSTGKVIG